MPFLRQEPDNSLAETLGNLGNSLGNALNPLNRIRAQDMAIQIQQRQQEVQQAQQRDAANANAAEVYGNLNPQGLSPADLAITKAQIRNGTYPGMENVVNGLAASANYKDRSAAADLFASSHQGSWDSAHIAAAHARILAGQSDASTEEQNYANAAKDTNAATATIAATGSATTPTSKEAAAIGQPEASSKLEAQNRIAITPAPDPSDPDYKTKLDKLNADRLAAGYPAPPLGTALAPSLQPAADADAAARGGEAERQKKVGELVGGGIAPTGNYFPRNVPGSPTNPLGAPLPATSEYPPSPLDGASPAATAAPPPAKDVVLPNAASPSATPTPVVTQVPGGGAVVGETAPEATQRTAVDTANRTQLQDAVDAGVAGKKMLVILDRLNTLADLANTGGSGQFPTWVDGWLRDHGLVMTDRQGILAEMKAEFNAQIPELRKDMGVKFEAGPELSAQSKMIGDPSLPARVLKGIFARQAAIANLGIQRRDLAMRALYPQQANPLSVADYYKQEAQIYDNLGAEMQSQLKEFGAYTPTTQTPPPLPAATNTGSTMDAIRALLRHLGGATDAQAPAPPAVAPTEQWDVDAQGRPVRVR